MEYIDTVIKYNDKYYIKLGPIQGYIDNLEDYIYVELSDLDNAVLFIEIVSHLIRIGDLYDILINNTELNILISQGLYDSFENNELPVEIIINDNDIEYVSGYNLNNLISRNTLSFTEDELYSFYQTFFTIINDQTTDDIDYTNILNVAYKRVIEYFMNGMNDAGLENINIILNTVAFDYNDTDKYSNSTCGSCANQMGISSSSSTSSSSTINGLTDYSSLSCVDKYKEAMKMWLIKMLSSIEFYNEWFFIEESENNYMPNETLIDNLILLLNDFKALNLDLTFSKSFRTHCNCEELLSGKTLEAEKNEKIIDDYIKVLNWIKNCEIEENTNKIKIYGELFAELLPYLSF